MSRDFQLALDKWQDKVTLDVKKFTKLVTFKVFDRIILRTPVDTGRCRASWAIGVNEVKVDDQPATFAGGATAARSVADSRKIGVVDANLYVIANGLHYVEKLENGWSRQAPAGMVRLAIADVKTELEVAFG